MYVLTQISWDETGLWTSGGNDSENPAVGMIAMALSYIRNEFTPSNLVMYRLWERQHYIRAYEQFDEMYQAHLAREIPVEAKNLALEQYIQQTINAQTEANSQVVLPTDIVKAVWLIFRRGCRWRTLVHAIESGEVLLLDQTVQLMNETITVGRVIDVGTDEDFVTMKDFLLDPENRLRENCLRLSGVSDMLF